MHMATYQATRTKTTVAVKVRTSLHSDIGYFNRKQICRWCIQGPPRCGILARHNRHSLLVDNIDAKELV